MFGIVRLSSHSMPRGVFAPKSPVASSRGAMCRVLRIVFAQGFSGGNVPKAGFIGGMPKRFVTGLFIRGIGKAFSDSRVFHYYPVRARFEPVDRAPFDRYSIQPRHAAAGATRMRKAFNRIKPSASC
uniref:Uncharacterized protein n=1 Tax=Candidatus Kentrum sp. TC TaxID=2126339 RepID=A0A450YTW2_9GAMM|nr:MAG: hypothetical protein BECKTC1821D_GA0114238_102237 [Candidatus Kentron sp. TC]